MTSLKPSFDRKVTNYVTKSKQAGIANTFGLPSGVSFSCVNATAYCLTICYAGRIEKLRKAVFALLMHNWNLLRNASQDEMTILINEMISRFVSQSIKKKAPLIFRIHWDGDFFNEDYVRAWIRSIADFPNVQFWVYTRVPKAAVLLQETGFSNLSLYFSADVNNSNEAKKLYKKYGTKNGLKIRMAYVGETFSEGEVWMKELTGKPGAKCPENVHTSNKQRQLPLISEEGSACYRCGLCVWGKSDIRFSRTKK